MRSPPVGEWVSMMSFSPLLDFFNDHFSSMIITTVSLTSDCSLDYLYGMSFLIDLCRCHFKESKLLPFAK